MKKIGTQLFIIMAFLLFSFTLFSQQTFPPVFDSKCEFSEEDSAFGEIDIYLNKINVPTPTTTPSPTCGYVIIQPTYFEIVYPVETVEINLSYPGADSATWSNWGGLPDWISFSKSNGTLQSGESDKIIATVDWNKIPPLAAYEGETWIGYQSCSITGDYQLRFKAYYDFNTNVALNKPIFASTIFSGNYPAVNANDGNLNTAWGSSTLNQDEWIYVDLGQVREINGAGFKWLGDYYPKKYHIYLSNDKATWTKVATITKNTNSEDIFYATANTRCVALLIEEKNEVAIGLAEFELYIMAMITPTPTPTTTVIPTTSCPPATPTPTVTMTPTTTAYPSCTCTPPPLWYPGISYDLGEKVTFNEKIWECTIAHTSLESWYPGAPGVYLWQETI